MSPSSHLYAESRPRYVELPPSADLAPWVACYWSIRGDAAAPMPNRVLPDGCADVIVGIGGDARPVAVGAMRTAALVPLVGRVDLFGVRFRPGAALPFLGLPLRELTDGRAALAALWGSAAAAVEDVAAHAALHARAARMERVLTARLRAWRTSADETLAARAVALLRQARGGAAVRDVAAALGVGERRLERAFDRAVGLGPKALARVVRFRRALRGIERSAGAHPPVWTAVAYDAGYADQSHLIREFRALAGVSPSRWAAERARVGFVQYADDASA